MSRQIVFYGDHFIDFYKVLDTNTKTKFKYVLELIKQVEHVPRKFLTPITAHAGLFEIRIEYQSNIYRVFCCFDKGKLVILFNAFQKKTQKTPKKEIEKAWRLKNEYFSTKNKRK